MNIQGTNMMKNNSIVLILTCLLFGLSCQNQDKDNEYIPLDKKASQQDIVTNSVEKEKKIKEIFYSLPSPLELSLMFKREGAIYHGDVLHKISDVDNYNTLRKKALNLGVYGADLSYAGLFSNTQDAISYFVTSKKLAEDIGISQVFEKDFITRLEQNAGNQDTLLQVITDFFLENDIYLKTQAQQHISTYVLLGGWIESMYLGGEMINRNQIQGLKEVFAKQKPSMQNMINLLNSIPEEHAEDSLKVKMETLAAIYDKVEIYYHTTESDNLQTNLAKSENDLVQVKMSEPVFQAILKELKSIRNYLIR